MIIINNKNGLSDDEIRQLEFRLKVNIPESYKTFLNKYNGGRPSPDCFLISVEEGGTSISGFLGKRGRKEYYFDLVYSKEMFAGRIPEDLLIIANDSFGNQICIGHKPHNYGQIYFWDHNYEADTDQGEVVDYSNIVLVADDFDSFIDSLYEFDESQLPD